MGMTLIMCGDDSVCGMTLIVCGNDSGYWAVHSPAVSAQARRPCEEEMEVESAGCQS